MQNNMNDKSTESHPDIEQEGIGNSRDGEVPDMLKAWELDPHFNDCTRAIPMRDYISLTTLSTFTSELEVKDEFMSSTEPSKQSLDKNMDPCSFRDSYSTTAMEFFDMSPRSCSSSSCPERPLHLKQTHLRMRIGGLGDHTNNDSEAIVRVVNHCLESFHEFDFSYIPASMSWKGKFLQGCSQCVIRIHLYCELPAIHLPILSTEPLEIQYIIEVSRNQGDARPFYEFFKEFKHKMVSMGYIAASRESSLGNLTLTSCEESSSSLLTDYVTEDVARSGLTSSVSQPLFVQNQAHSTAAPSHSTHPPLTSSASAPLLHQPQFSPNGSGVSCASGDLFTSPCASHFIPNIPSPSSCVFNCPEDYLNALRPILTMAYSSLYETQLEAARMLWDISAQHQPHQQQPCCVEKISHALEHLILYTTFHSVREQAIVTLARFIDIPGYAQYFLKSTGVVWLLQSYLTNPLDDEKAYDSAQLRRECAYILAALVSCDATSILRHLQTPHGNIFGVVSKKKPSNKRIQNNSDILTCLQAYEPSAATGELTTNTEGPTEQLSVPVPERLTEESLISWLESLEELKDVRLKTQAVRVRDGLMRAIQRNSNSHHQPVESY